jgi:proteasome lid subunit RPN8/RPN11
MTIGVRAAMLAHARREAPKECCGLLVGTGPRIDECVPVRNVSPSPATRYVLDPAEHIATRRRLRGTGREVVGCYHSHPASPAVPSETDIADAHYPEFAWVIVSLADPARPDVAAYRIVEGCGMRLDLVTKPVAG